MLFLKFSRGKSGRNCIFQWNSINFGNKTRLLWFVESRVLCTLPLYHTNLHNIILPIIIYAKIKKESKISRHQIKTKLIRNNIWGYMYILKNVSQNFSPCSVHLTLWSTDNSFNCNWYILINGHALFSERIWGKVYILLHFHV